jgi:hypothetical protein
MRGGSSDRPNSAVEAETVSKRRQERLEKYVAGTQLGIRKKLTRKMKLGGDKQRRSDRMNMG